MKHHKGLTLERWSKFSLAEQLANVGADVERAIKWKKRERSDYAQQAVERVLELMYLTIADIKNKKRLSELCRVREALVDYLVYDNVYQSTSEAWQRYFYYFGYLAAAERGT